MKMTRENYELLLFELLEGELSQEDAHQVMQQIEKDAFYKKEWDLMQRSVLHEDDHPVLFTKKDLLLRPTGRRIFMFTPVAKYAAAAALVLIGGWWLAKTFLLNDDSGNKITKTEETIVPSEMPVDDAVGIEDDVNYDRTAVAKNEISESKKVQRVVKVDAGGSTDQVAVIKVADPVIADLSYKTVNTLGIDNSPPEMTMIQPFNTELAILPDLVFQNDDKDGTSLREVINDGLAKVMGPLSEPKIKISRVKVSRADEKEALAFNVTFTSVAYKTNAYVQLKR